MEPHLVEVSRTQTLEILEMPLMQPYVKQGLGLHLVEDPEAPVGLEDLEEEQIHQYWLHTWF